MGKFCNYPFSRMHISQGGAVYVCCSSWLRKPIGNIFNDDFESVWNSAIAISIRKTILNGSFEFCDHKVCPLILSGRINSEIISKKIKEVKEKNISFLKSGPEHLSLNYDNSCNLNCDSCRSNIKVIEEEEIGKLISFQNSLLKSKMFKGVKKLIVTGAGEPFASKVFMDLFRKISKSDYPQLKITLRTNGILLTPGNWKTINSVHYAIDSILISIDAATGSTYNKVRNGGDFNKLKSNLKFISDLKGKNKLKIGFNFVVQKQNFLEMPAFIKFAKRYNCDEVTFTQLLNLGTYTDLEFSEYAVHQQEHPQHNKFKSVLKRSIFKDPIVSLSNLSYLIEN